MLRVCLVGLIAGGRSGVPRYAAALTSALDRVAPEFPALSLCLLTNVRGAHRAAVRNIAVDLVSGPLASASAGLRRVLAEQVHTRALEADLLHFFDLTGPMLARRRPFVATIHDAAIRYGFEAGWTAHKRVLQPWAIRHARAVVAVSEFAREEAVRQFDAEPARIQVIHSGPGLLADDGNGRADVRGPFVLYVGNLDSHKNLPFLVRAFEAADVEGRLILAGYRGGDVDEVERAVELSSVRDRIEIRRDATDAEVDRLYRDASMLVLPSRYEGFGFTALEAMARGCPVLASDVPALREISGDGAWLLPADDEASWAAAIRRVMGDGTLREELRRRGEAAVRRYSWEATARRLCELFTQIRSDG